MKLPEALTGVGGGVPAEDCGAGGEEDVMEETEKEHPRERAGLEVARRRKGCASFVGTEESCKG